MTRAPAAVLFWAAFALAAAAASVAARAPVIRDRPLCGYLDNDDAPAHVAATMIAYDDTPARHHKFLPIATMGAVPNKWEPAFRDAGGFDKRGNFYYTSFPPLAFAVPQLVRKVLGFEATAAFVRWFSVALHLLSAALLAALIARLTGSAAGAAVGSAAFLLMPECLKSFGVSYWAHQLYQPILLGQLLCLATGRWGWPLRLLTVAGCLTEWTAYPVAVALGAVLLARWRFLGDRRAIPAGAGVLLSAVAAGACMVAWYSSVLGLKPYLAALAKRAQTRAALADEPGGPLHWLGQLAGGYEESLGAFGWLFLAAILLAGLPALAGAWKDRLKPALQRSPQIDWVHLAVAMVLLAAMSENVLMCQHAVVYTFARVKGVAAAALLVGAAASFGRVAHWSFAAAVCGAGWVALGDFGATYNRASGDSQFPFRRYEALGELVRRTCPADAVALTDDPVRGAEVFYCRRNLIELPRLGDHSAPEPLAKLTPFLEHFCHVHCVPVAVCYQVQPERSRFVITRFDRATKQIRQAAWSPGAGVDPPPWPEL